MKIMKKRVLTQRYLQALQALARSDDPPDLAGRTRVEELVTAVHGTKSSRAFTARLYPAGGREDG